MRKGTRVDYIDESRRKGEKVYFGAIAQAIKDGEITCYLDDNGKSLIDFDDADQYFAKKRAARKAVLNVDLFAV